MTNLRGNVFVRMAIFIFAVLGIVTIVSLQLKYNNLKLQRDAAAAEIAAAQERVDALEESLAAPFDDEYVIKIARERLNYRLPEEIVFYNDLNN